MIGVVLAMMIIGGLFVLVFIVSVIITICRKRQQVERQWLFA